MSINIFPKPIKLKTKCDNCGNKKAKFFAIRNSKLVCDKCIRKKVKQ